MLREAYSTVLNWKRSRADYGECHCCDSSGSHPFNQVVLSHIASVVVNSNSPELSCLSCDRSCTRCNYGGYCI